MLNRSIWNKRRNSRRFYFIKKYLTKEFKYHSDRNNKNLITDKEHRVIFNPPRTINKSEINKAISSINKKMNEAAEEFYRAKKDYYVLWTEPQKLDSL